MPDPRDPAVRPPVGVAPLDRDVPRAAPVSPSPANLPAPVREPAIPDPARPPVPVERRLPEHRGKLSRIGDAITGLSEDLKAWIELRIQILQTEVQEQVEFRAAQAKRYAAAGLFAALGGFFLLVALGLLFGWLFALVLDVSLLLAAFLGFLLLTVLLLLIGYAAYRALQPKPPPSAPLQHTP